MELNGDDSYTSFFFPLTVPQLLLQAQVPLVAVAVAVSQLTPGRPAVTAVEMIAFSVVYVVMIFVHIVYIGRHPHGEGPESDHSWHQLAAYDFHPYLPPAREGRNNGNGSPVPSPVHSNPSTPTRAVGRTFSQSQLSQEGATSSPDARIIVGRSANRRIDGMELPPLSSCVKNGSLSKIRQIILSRPLFASEDVERGRMWLCLLGISPQILEESVWRNS